MLALLRFAGLVAALFMGLSISRAGETFSFAKTPGRLPKDIIPSAYRIHLEPSLETATAAGRETIDLQVVAPTRQIVLNSAELMITSATLRRKGEGDVALRIDSNDTTQLLTLTADAEIPAGACQLEGLHYVIVAVAAAGLEN
jgi:aminopeptidase N